MKNTPDALVTVFNYLKILLKDENKTFLDFLDIIKDSFKAKAAKLEETEEEEDFMGIVREKIKENEELRNDCRKELLEDLLKSEKDEVEKILLLIDLIVFKNKSKSMDDESEEDD